MITGLHYRTVVWCPCRGQLETCFSAPRSLRLDSCLDSYGRQVFIETVCHESMCLISPFLLWLFFAERWLRWVLGIVRLGAHLLRGMSVPSWPPDTLVAWALGVQNRNASAALPVLRTCDSEGPGEGSSGQ